MTSPVETTAAMTPQAEQHASADAADGSPGSGTTALTGPAPEGVASISSSVGEQAAGRRELSQNAVISLFGGLVTALLGGLIGLMMWQFDSLGNRIEGQNARIDSLGARIDAVRTELRAEIDDLEAEMRAGFAEINAVLLDHTDRLARLETAAGLPRLGD